MKRAYLKELLNPCALFLLMLAASGPALAQNTPTGDNVAVHLEDPFPELGTGIARIMVTFENITLAGETTTALSDENAVPHAAFLFLESWLPSGVPFARESYFNITTTAEHSGRISVCVETEDQTHLKFLVLLHWENGEWKDIETDSSDTAICGDVASLEATDAQPNSPPVFGFDSAPFTLLPGQSFEFSFTVTDPDGDDVTVAGLDLPAGADLSPTSGATPLNVAFSWTPTMADLGLNFINITATDAHGASLTTFFKIHVVTAEANTISGRLWRVTDAIAHNAAVANIPQRAADVTFDVISPFNFYAENGTIGDWLANGGAFNISEKSPGALNAPMGDFIEGTLVEFAGVARMTAGQGFFARHDDGATLIIGGTDFGLRATGPEASHLSWNGPSGMFPFQLVYAERGGIADLVVEAYLSNPLPPPPPVNAYEGFDYPASGDLSGQNGGTGWTTIWGINSGGATVSGNASGDTTLAESLSYTDILGNRLVTSGNRGFYTGQPGVNSQPFRDVANIGDSAGADGTTTWISVLIQRSGPRVEGLNPYPRGANISFWHGNTEMFAIGNPSGMPDSFLSLQHGGGVCGGADCPQLLNRRPTTTPFDQLSFAVLRIDHLPGNDNAYLFVNPPLDREPDISTVAAWTQGEFDYTFNRVRPFAGNTMEDRPYAELTLDEIRIGTSYAEVTPHIPAQPLSAIASWGHIVHHLELPHFLQLVGDDHCMLGLKNDGTVMSWGLNVYGRATPPADLDGVIGIALGGSHALAVTSDGRVLGWGNNNFGAAIAPAGLASVVAIAAGASHSLALRSDGTVMGWGNNYYGQASPPGGLAGVRAIAAGFVHSLALKFDGTVVGWGYNGNRQAVPPLDLNNVVAIAGGVQHSLALKADGTVIGWGTDYYGKALPQATPPSGLSRVVAMAAGSEHSLALISDGTVVGWGGNRFGQASPPTGLRDVVGIGAGERQSFALKRDGTLVFWGRASEATPLPASEGIAEASPGYEHGLALRSDGTVFGWGSSYSAAAIPPAGLVQVTKIAAGGYHNLALRSDGSIIGWGNDAYRQTNPFSDLGRVVAIAAGEYHSVALKSDGTVEVWGDFNHGQRLFPTDLFGPLLVGVVAIDAGAYHSLALKSDGTVLGWGFNNAGQTSPPADLTGVISIAAGGYHSLALKSDGTVVGWGYNSYGQASPPANLSGVVAIAAGLHHSLALKSDGTISGWGHNHIGQATPPADLRGVISIAARGNQSLALVRIQPTQPNRPETQQPAVPQNGFTSRGEYITVQPTDPATGLPPVILTFENVTSEGVTTVSSQTFPTNPEPPPSFKFGDPPVLYHIQTTAEFTGEVLVCFTWQEGAFSNEAALRLYHSPDGQNDWIDVTTSVDTLNNTICGIVNGFSFFGIFQPIDPIIVNILAPVSGLLDSVNRPIQFVGSFTQGGSGLGFYDASWTYESAIVPSTILPGTITGTSVADTFQFATPGVYRVKLTVADDAGDSSTGHTVNGDLPAYVVIYDPEGGFVTGGGWLMSPAGALHPSLDEYANIQGKASFGFVSKYLKGATVPSGNTEFQFQAGNLNFKSARYQWLTVAGARAQFKGWGSINGQGEYAFILTAIDGQVTGGGGYDRFRIKIWDEASGAVIYDNKAGTDDNAELDDSTIIRGGSIVIHTKK